ncbi:S8 family serine peptidase [Clostridium gasigenes]|uniref:S8 family serine peptidase n=1 Tax=Clostridium gasigenes TaxID=94869 RepID=UPI003393C8BB
MVIVKTSGGAIIETNSSDSILNENNQSAENFSKALLSKLNIIGKTDQVIEVVIISGESAITMGQFVNSLGGTYEYLGYGFAVVNIAVDKLGELAKNRSIQYIEIAKQLYTTDSSSNRAACVQPARDTFGIEGEGALIGFIDSGIDYTHPAFINEDGTTRIEYIYDLSEGGNIYNKEKINEALKSPDPFSIVTSYDEIGHGTHVAGIACAGGKINPNYYGVAPKSSIIMVKSTRGDFALSTSIMRGLKFLVDKGKELKMPLAVNISLSTNDGAHNGTSLLEQYISTIATVERITICIAAGNEGSASHHVGGELKGENRIALNIAGDEKNVVINLYKDVLQDISIQIINPTGAASGYIEVKEGYVNGSVGLDRYRLLDTGPKPFDMVGEIVLSLITNNQYISAGQWQILIRANNNYTGMFDMWLPILEGLNIETKFSQPTVTNTLGIPATVRNIIAVGSYNYINNNISPFSGRGRPTVFCPIRPDLVAPGENIISVVPNRGFDTKTGTSMATPHVVGIAALLMEWGLAKNNDPFLFGERLKFYLVRGANRNRTDVIYPNVSWGYGEVCAYNAFQIVSQVINSLKYSRSEKIVDSIKTYNEYNIGSLFIRKPI